MEAHPKMQPRVAYFCAEFGLEGLPMGGGLGILAADYLKSCADLGLPVVGVGLNYQRRIRQRLDDSGEQTERREIFDPTGIMNHLHQTVAVQIQERDVSVGAWKLNIVGQNEHVVPLILLDTNGHNGTRTYDNDICELLYPSKHAYHRLTQEEVLGIGGVRMLDTLGYEIDRYHLNEGHAALAGLELLTRHGFNESKRRLVFTTHTPVPAGIEEFTRDIAEDVLRGSLPSREEMQNLTGSGNLNMPRLAMALSSESFGVSPLHAEVSRRKFSNFPNMDGLYSIDNGVHIPTWASLPVQNLYDEVTNGEWHINPKSLERLLEVPEQTIWNVHQKSREHLGEFLDNDQRVRSNGSTYNPDKLTIGFARRFATYKQATLVFEDLEKLSQLGNDIQIVFAGKAHPSDTPGKEVIKEVFKYMNELRGKVAVWFIEDYNMQVAKYMVRGVDLWLNNPMILQEASGTSGMKNAVNLIPQFSILDGWFVRQEPDAGYTLPKGHIEGVTGWSIGEQVTQEDFRILLDDNLAGARRDALRRENANSLYDKLHYEIVPKFRDHRMEYAKVMRGAAAHNASWFNSHRMALEYFSRAYGIPVTLEGKVAA